MDRYTKLRAFLGGDTNEMFENPDEGLLVMDIIGESAEYRLLARADDRAGIVTLIAQSHSSSPPQLRNHLTVLLAAANLELPAGAWIHDTSDGRFGFRLGMPLSPEDMTLERMQQFLLSVCASLERGLPAIEGLLSGQISLEDAFAHIHDRS